MSKITMQILDGQLQLCNHDFSYDMYATSNQCKIFSKIGTSTTKYTTPLPHIGLSESDSQIYIIFKFCEGKYHKDLEKQIDVQSQAKPSQTN